MWWEVKRLPKPRTGEKDKSTVPHLTKWVKEETGEFKLNDAAVKYYADSKKNSVLPREHSRIGSPEYLVHGEASP